MMALFDVQDIYIRIISSVSLKPCIDDMWLNSGFLQSADPLE